MISGIFGFVTPLGFEPKTHSLEGCCSIQLSYGARPYLLAGTNLAKVLFSLALKFKKWIWFFQK